MSGNGVMGLLQPRAFPTNCPFAVTRTQHLLI